MHLTMISAIPKEGLLWVPESPVQGKKSLDQTMVLNIGSKSIQRCVLFYLGVGLKFNEASLSTG